LAQLAEEPDLTYRHEGAIDGAVTLRRGECEGKWQVKGGLIENDAANQVGVDVAVAQRNPGATRKHRGQEGEARGVEPATCAPRCAVCRASNQCLHLNQHRAAPLQERRDNGARRTLVAIVNKGTTRVFDSREAALTHLKQPKFIGRPEAVLCGAQRAQRAVTIAVEHDYCVNKVFKRLRPRDAPLFGDMPNEDHCGTGCTCDTSEYLGAPAHLAHTPCRAF
jgi:hypothetical protein